MVVTLPLLLHVWNVPKCCTLIITYFLSHNFHQIFPIYLNFPLV